MCALALTVSLAGVVRQLTHCAHRAQRDTCNVRITSQLGGMLGYSCFRMGVRELVHVYIAAAVHLLAVCSSRFHRHPCYRSTTQAGVEQCAGGLVCPYAHAVRVVNVPLLTLMIHAT